MSAPISAPALVDRGPTAPVHIGRGPTFDAKRTVVADELLHRTGKGPSTHAAAAATGMHLTLPADRVVRCATTTTTTTTTITTTTTTTTTTGSCTCMHSTPRNGGTGWLCR